MEQTFESLAKAIHQLEVINEMNAGCHDRHPRLTQSERRGQMMGHLRKAQRDLTMARCHLKEKIVAERVVEKRLKEREALGEWSH